MPRSRAARATRTDHVRVVGRRRPGRRRPRGGGGDSATKASPIASGPWCATVGRLGVGALADARPHPLGRQALDVGRGAMQVGLDDRARVHAVGAQAVDDLEGALGVGRDDSMSMRMKTPWRRPPSATGASTARHSSTPRSRPIWVSLMLTLASRPSAAMRSMVATYAAAARSAEARSGDRLAEDVERGALRRPH